MKLLPQRWHIYPHECNPYPGNGTQEKMVHGGEVLKKADQTAAILVKKALENTGLYGLTVGVDKCQFYSGPSCGDLVDIHAEIVDLGKHRISVKIKMLGKNNKEVFVGMFHFCSFRREELGRYYLCPHYLRKSVD